MPSFLQYNHEELPSCYIFSAFFIKLNIFNADIGDCIQLGSFAHKVRKLSDLIGAAEKFYYKFMIRMPLFGSDSNIILRKSNKELSFQDLRSRLESLIKLLQESIHRRSESHLTTFQYCLVSSAWEEEEEELENKVKLKKNSNLSNSVL